MLRTIAACDHITFEQSITYGNGEVSYPEVTNSDIDIFLSLGQLTEDREHNLDDVTRICSIITGIRNGDNIPLFEVWYRETEDHEYNADIYDGWHRIRAYQYLGYREIPCIKVN